MSLVAKTPGMRWATLAVVTNVGFNRPVMLCLLASSVFGLIAIRFLSYFAQLGVSSALVQKPDLAGLDARHSSRWPESDGVCRKVWPVGRNSCA